MILAGDIGGTKTVLAFFEKSGETLRRVRDATFPSREHATFETILQKFLSDSSRPPVSAACFGVAGAVIEGKCRTTNLPWELDETALAQAMGARRVKLLNDLEAMAYGMLYLRPDEMAVLNTGPGPRRRGNVAVIAAGTGLGEAMLAWDGAQHHPVASEGGHADFSAQTDLEIDLLRWLRGKCQGHVSWERVLSGPGFINLYEFLRDSGRYPEPPWLTEKLKTGERSVLITQIGMAGQDPLCTATVELFCRFYGVEAGNLALKCVAVGGVFIGGGIAPKMLAALARSSFMEGFTDKGRFSSFLKEAEVRVALNPQTPLLGAANYAVRL